ncbi:S8 family serine peptidase [Clostridium sp. YIM B02515]|uniref:S8 family serine peptidase n=1 Tax=Clostridium rhizosphaerae TaxID=2803861 RepID=A0ABS1TCJ4_9CLOT|nr:S8 family serine peptidase [Clostridium rhizosphaerae]MBL4937080.1 S8 family serine peptidase [Clostridium rhizosphaerae]
MKRYRYILLINIVVILLCGGYLIKDKLLNNKLTEEKPVANKPVESNLDKMYELPAFYEDFPSPEKLRLIQVDLRRKDLSELDLKGRSKDLFNAYFDSTTKWPSKDKMPEDFTPEKVLELGKDPGLGISKLHKEGITGKNIGIAILDSPLKNKHVDYNERIKHYEEMFNPIDDNLEHGPAVTSIAAGKSVGVASEADIYYFADDNDYTDKNGNTRNDFEKVAKVIDRVIEINKTLPEDKKIRVISMSEGCGPEDKGYKEFKDAVSRAGKEGIFAISSILEDTHGFKFSGLGRFPADDNNNVSSFVNGKFYQNKLSKFTSEEFLKSVKDYLYFPMDSRAVAGPNSDNEYIFYRFGAYSWVVPYISGLYALSCEVNPKVTPELFWKTALETSKETKFDYKSKTYEIKHVVSPVDLIEKLRALK